MINNINGYINSLLKYMYFSIYLSKVIDENIFYQVDKKTFKRALSLLSRRSVRKKACPYVADITIRYPSQVFK